MTAPRRRTSPAEAGDVGRSAGQADQDQNTPTAQTVATAVEILLAIADDLISWGHPLEGQILRARASTVHGTYAADLVASTYRKVLLDPAEPKIWVLLKFDDGRRHAITLGMFKRPAGGAT